MANKTEVKAGEVMKEKIETSIPNEADPKKKITLELTFDRDKLIDLIKADPKLLDYALAGWKIGVFQKTVRAFNALYCNFKSFRIIF